MSFTARTVDEIFQQLITYKNTIPELTGLTSSVSDEQSLLDELQSDSNTARWILELYVHAYNTWVLENLMEKQVTELEDIRDASFSGTKAWYESIAQKFQYGDTVTVDESTGYVPEYTLEDENKQIIAQVSSDEISGKLFLKIRGKDTDLLTTDQLNAFNTYIDSIKFVGTQIGIINLSADKLKVYGTVRYDGQVDLTVLQANVQEVIDNYILNISFNSYFIRSELIDVVKAIDGVTDFEINTLQARKDTVSTFTDIVHRYQALAGYLRIDDNHSLSNTLNYTIEQN